VIEEPYIEPVIEEPWNGAEIHGQYIVHILNISREIPADTLCNYSLPFGQGDMSSRGRHEHHLDTGNIRNTGDTRDTRDTRDTLAHCDNICGRR
jgi:hypothetical protein